MKKLFTLLLTVAASTVMMQAAIVDGTCGDNLTWSLNTKDSTLTISGSGKMTNWSSSSSVPWLNYASYIKYVSLPDGLTSIGGNAFYGCIGLTSVTIPNSVTSIGEGAFYICSGLTSIEIPNSVTSIGNWAFIGCSGLTGELTIPNSVTSIGDYAFYNCSGLASLTIPNSVTSIGTGAFGGCYSMTSVTIPNSVTSIGERAFEDCSGLTSVTIPNSVTSIGERAFEDCSGLTSVTIPNSVTSIGNSAFYGCNQLTKITVLATTPPSANNAGVDRATCKLYVPAESVDAYANAIWWEDFASIRAIGSGFIVKFLNWDETVLSSQEVDSGESAIAPINPTRTGYTFIGWDKDFSNITEDLIVTAQYQINRFEVVFKDWDGTILQSDSVNWSTAAVAPTDPSREGYTFIGWDKDFSNITEDLTITALYELGEYKDFTIYFNGKDGENILYNEVAIKVPSAPEIAGFTFIGWRPVANIIEFNSIEIQAIYTANSPTSAPAVYTNPANPAQKLIKNGNVYILTDDKTYTITGQLAK